MSTILILDDEKAIVRSLAAFFQRALTTWEVVSFDQGSPAMAFLQADGSRDVKFAVVDLCMESMDGRAFIEQALKTRPDLRGRICVFSGSVLLDDDDPLFIDLGCKRLDKPFEIEQLRELVRSVVGG